jgi:hypothetical protein
MVNLFKNHELVSARTFNDEKTARSLLYPGLSVEVGQLFEG